MKTDDGVAYLLGFRSTTAVTSYDSCTVKPRDLVAVISERKCGYSLYHTCSLSEELDLV